MTLDRSTGCQILINIQNEVEKGQFLQKKDQLVDVLSQMPPERFQVQEKCDDRSIDIRESYIRTILSLIESCHLLMKKGSDAHAKADAGDAEGKHYQDHAALTQSVLSIINILLTKLSANSEQRPSNTTQQNKHIQATYTQSKEDESRCDGTSSSWHKGDDIFDNVGEGNLLNSQTHETFHHVDDEEEEERGHFSIRPLRDGHFRQKLRNDGPGKEESANNDEKGTFSRRLLKRVLTSILGPAVVLCAAHANSHMWTHSSSLQASHELLAKFVHLCGFDSVSSFLRGGHHERQQPGAKTSAPTLMARGAFGPALAELKLQLTRMDWKTQPAAKYSFTWLLAHIKHPYLGEHLDFCLPPSLLFVDDFEVENKILGIQCLQHIIDNVDPTELRQYGRADVIYEALQPLMHIHKPDLIDALYPCLLSTLRVIERDPKKADKPRQLGRYGNTLQVILTNMEGEQRIAVRRANARHLGSFVEAMGITILWHMKTLMRVIVSYLETSDGSEETGRILTLRILQTVIVQAWPRMSNHCVELLKAILRILVDISGDTAGISPQVKETLVEESTRCMVLLKRCCGSVVADSMNELLGSNLPNGDLKDRFQEVLVR